MDTPKKEFDEWMEAGFECRLLLSPSELECFLCMHPSAPKSLTPEALSELLQNHGILFGLQAEALAEACEQVQLGKRVSELLVASGTTPVEAVHATAAFDVMPSSEAPRYEKNEDDAVNYHQANLFENVLSGEQIGVLVPMTEGKSGRSVLGRTLPVPECKNAPPPRAGTGAELREDGRFVATCDGRVVFADGVISVSDELIIEGDVDYGCGDIDFVGFVHVKRSVREGFTVRAGKGLVIEHVVENVCIESDGDIRVGGVAGDGEHCVVRCSGNFTARYLHEVQVECAGNVTVTGEIMNCRLLVGGSVESAMLSGGVAYAAAGLDVKRLGGDTGIHTYVCAGMGYEQVQSLEAVDLRLASLMQHKSHLMERKVDVPEDAAEDVLAAAQELEHEFEELLAEIDAVEAERLALCEVSGDGQNAKVNIGKAVFEGVTIHLGHTQEEVTEYRPGACSVIEYMGSKLVFLSYTPLDKNAKELEQEHLRDEQARF